MALRGERTSANGQQARQPAWVALDGLGGDHAPEEVVKGAATACRELGAHVIITGPTGRIEALLQKEDYPAANIAVVDAPEAIGMGEHAVEAIRHKKGSSLVAAVSLVYEGRASAVISAGSTGAAMAASLLGLGRIKGVDRPAIAIPFPTERGVTVVLDIGANADTKPAHLAQFAVMGSIYAEKVLGIAEPKVGLLSIGEEETKGSSLVIEAHVRLKEGDLPIRFVGNVEGRDIPAGTVDVVVTDGFTGNVVLKLAEGLGGAIFSTLKKEISGGLRYKLGAALLLPALKDLKTRLDYSEYGGAPLLGVRGVSIIAHGRSDAKAIKNAIRVATEAVEKDLVGTIEASLNESQRNAGKS